MIPDPICSLFSQALETVEHLFLLCAWTKEVWLNPCFNLTVNSSGITRMDKWLTEVLSLDRDTPSRELTAEVLWTIWKARNAQIFQGRIPDPPTIVQSALTQHKNYMRWNPCSDKQSNAPAIIPERWKLPDRGKLKFNIDGSRVEGASMGSVAGVCRDSTGALELYCTCWKKQISSG
ncbi:hypothetical protein BT93_H2022 [Corymbia citriodora subsp. variegata]|nr:hypothetical protein BT93_H2022 [Corymbia citriodora subsp. variegata]